MDLELKPSNNEVLIENLIGFKGKILFGVPESTNNYIEERGNSSKQIEYRRKGMANTNNAQLLAILENGSPVKNLPPRPLLKPVVERHKDKILEEFQKIYECLVIGDNDKADMLLNRLAQRVEKWGKEFFREDNGWEPDKPATIHAKNRRAGLPKDAPTTTLIDTASLRGAIRAIYVKK